METFFRAWEQLDRWRIGDWMHNYTDSGYQRFECVRLVHDFSVGEILQSYLGDSEDETVAGELTVHLFDYSHLIALNFLGITGL
jgi:hypothetical protein